MNMYSIAQTLFFHLKSIDLFEGSEGKRDVYKFDHVIRSGWSGYPRQYESPFRSHSIGNGCDIMS